MRRERRYNNSFPNFIQSIPVEALLVPTLVLKALYYKMSVMALSNLGYGGSADNVQDEVVSMLEEDEVA